MCVCVCVCVVRACVSACVVFVYGVCGTDSECAHAAQICFEIFVCCCFVMFFVVVAL